MSTVQPNNPPGKRHADIVIQSTGESIAEYRKRKREERKANGQCLHCGRPRLGETQFCEHHANRMRAAYRRYQDKKPREVRRKVHAEWRDRNVAKGNCNLCANPKVPGKSLCEIHLKQRQREAGVRRKEFARRYAEQGLCIACGLVPKLPEAKRCEGCYFKDVSRRHFGRNHRGDELKQLFDASGGICKYTGQKLVLGQNTHLDHIVPRSQGGTHDKGNLQWISSDANRLKYDHSEAEFLQIIKGIVRHYLTSQ
jgi:hypothetical protein